MRIFLLAIACLLAVPAVASADEAAQIYEPDEIAVIDLGLSPTAEAALEDDHETYVEGTFELGIDDDGEPGGSVTKLTPSPMIVGIRLKGSVNGSFRPLTGKAAFKVKFKEFGGPKFLGLKKLTLNNMVEDPSMIHETLTYKVFRDLGLPASRTGYAFVRVNGHPYGVYLDIEDLDDVSLERIFGSFDDETQHLYEAEYHDDVVLGGATGFEVDEGEEDTIGDLEALIAAVNAPEPPAFAERLAPVADLEEMTLMWAVEKYIGRWDGYAGRAGTNQPNNYYLFSEPSGRFQMLPWGSDETWEEKLDFAGHAGLMFDLCLQDEACFARYWQGLYGARGAIAAMPLDGLAEELATLLEPWQEDDPRKGESQSQIEGAVAQARQFISARPGEASAWLDANEPPSREAPADSASPSKKVDLLMPTPPKLRRIGLFRHPDSFTIRLRASSAGSVSGRATMRTARGEQVVCSDRDVIHAAGTATLRCDLSADARRRLAKHRLWLTFDARLRDFRGQRVALATVVRLPRD